MNLGCIKYRKIFSTFRDDIYPLFKSSYYCIIGQNFKELQMGSWISYIFSSNYKTNGIKIGWIRLTDLSLARPKREFGGRTDRRTDIGFRLDSQYGNDVIWLVRWSGRASPSPWNGQTVTIVRCDGTMTCSCLTGLSRSIPWRQRLVNMQSIPIWNVTTECPGETWGACGDPVGGLSGVGSLDLERNVANKIWLE